MSGRDEGRTAVRVEIAGEEYTIRSDADEEYTRRCAALVDERMRRFDGAPVAVAQKRVRDLGGAVDRQRPLPAPSPSRGTDARPGQAPGGSPGGVIRGEPKPLLPRRRTATHPAGLAGDRARSGRRRLGDDPAGRDHQSAARGVPGGRARRVRFRPGKARPHQSSGALRLRGGRPGARRAASPPDPRPGALQLLPHADPRAWRARSRRRTCTSSATTQACPRSRPRTTSCSCTGWSSVPWSSAWPT